MILTEHHIEQLLRMRSISDEWPWCTDDEATIDGHFKDILAEVRRKTQAHDRTTFNHYGSGYASYVDAWLFRPPRGCDVEQQGDFQGVFVLFSRLTSFFVLGQGSKSWSAKRGSSYLPCFQAVDVFSDENLRAFAAEIATILHHRGLRRLLSADVAAFIPERFSVPTILTDPPFRMFDAIFYWED